MVSFPFLRPFVFSIFGIVFSSTSIISFVGLATSSFFSFPPSKVAKILPSETLSPILTFSWDIFPS